MPAFNVTAPFTVKEVNVPRDVIALCAAVVTVPAVVAVEALPVKAPTNVVEVTEVKPAIVVADEPNDIAVLPTVTDELVNEPFPILLNVFDAPLIVLLVNVCVPLIVAISISDPKGPAIHLSVVVFHNNEPDTNDAAVASLTTIPPFAAPEPFNDMILSPIATVVELTVVCVPDTTKLPPIVTVVPSSVIVELPTVDAEVNLTKVLFVPDTDTDVPEVPLVPEDPDVPELPLEPLEPEVPEVPEVAAVYDVPLMNNEPVTAILPLTAKLPVID